LVIILNFNQKFISIRWKLVSTYLLLIIITLLLINSFIGEEIRKSNINEKKVNLLTQGNIIADRVISYNFHLIESIETIDQLMKMHSIEIKSRVIILNNQAIVISDSFDILKGKTLKHDEIQQALSGNSVASQHELEDYGRTMYVAVPILTNNNIYGVVFISSSLEELYGNVGNIMRRYMLLSLISILITGLISFVFAHLIANPIEKLTESINKIYNGNIEQKVEIIGNDELGNLGRAFNLMSIKLSRVDKQRNDFVANVSHELKTPLTAMKIVSESLLHQEKSDIYIYRDFLKDIDSEVDRLNKIIDNLLSLVDMDQEALQIEYQLTYVNYLIEKLIRSLKPLAEHKKINLIFTEIDKIQIELDQIKIQQALSNIIYNAIKYTPERGTVHITLYNENNAAVIKIEDNGIGISADSLPHIFEKFYRVDKARSRLTGGTGLGLAIAQQIIVLHQGKIEVTSQLNEGTKFYVYLPKIIKKTLKL